METKVKRREWVKTAAIVLLSVLLVLTFFSNTIMNHSLPEVAAQYVEAGSINARIRGNGTVSANEVYEVTLAQTRKVQSVLVKVGQEVTAGDPLFVLESMDSEELRAAQEQLEQMELDYQKSLMSMSNDSSTEDRQIQKLREDYEEALSAYRVYTNVDPSRIETLLNEAKKELDVLLNKQTELQSELTRLQTDRNYLAAQSEITTLEAMYQSAEQTFAALEMENLALKQLETDIQNRIESIERTQGADWSVLYHNYSEFLSLAGSNIQICANNLEYFENVLRQNGNEDKLSSAKTLKDHYNAIAPIVELQNTLPTEIERLSMQRELDDAREAMNDASDQLLRKRAEVERYEADILAAETYIAEYSAYIVSQQAVVNNYQSASSAAITLKAAEEALEDAIFESNLGNTQNLDMEKARTDIEKQKELIEELSQEADGKEIAANVSGVISAIHVTAGNTAGAEQPIAEITVADRGYTVNITVTADQARQVRIGDTAQITNYYWGDISATLENIANDPQSMGQNKILIFRINGEGVEAGTNLSLSIGQKSANYDCLVPNSAIRSDSNGSFVLVVTSKSSPLGNRYQATRVEVQVLASDDTTSAVSGLSNGDFVITTSNKPLEAGDMIRLPDNG